MLLFGEKRKRQSYNLYLVIGMHTNPDNTKSAATNNLISRIIIIINSSSHHKFRKLLFLILGLKIILKLKYLCYKYAATEINIKFSYFSIFLIALAI